MKTNIEYYLSKLIKKLHLRAIRTSKIHTTSHVHSGSHLVNVQMGRYSYIGSDCGIYNTNIGSFCSFGSAIKIGGASHTVDWISTSPVFNRNKDSLTKKFSNHYFDPFNSITTIGNDVYIGDNVMIKAGVTVGDGAVIGMGSIVTKDIPPFEIWAGNPAKFIKRRFNNDIASDLLKMQWWNWSDDKIFKYALYFNDVPELIKRIKLEKPTNEK